MILRKFGQIRRRENSTSPGSWHEGITSGVDEFGLSNFSVADIEDVLAITTREEWIRPTVYEGLYNAVARVVETELFPALAEHGMRFQAYNPLAGGAFAPHFGTEDSVTSGSRFDPANPQAQMYRDCYWSEVYISALRNLHTVCVQFDIDAISAALRWLVHHSQLDSHRDDAIIIGASSPAHLQHNLSAVKQGPLPVAVSGWLFHSVLLAVARP